LPKSAIYFGIVFRLAGAGDEKVMDCKGVGRLIPPHLAIYVSFSLSISTSMGICNISLLKLMKGR